MLKNSCIALIMSILCYSCDSNLVFDEYQTVPNQWNKDSLVSFNVTPPDSTNTYNLFLNLRNNNSYKYSNLFLIVEMNYPNGKVQKDTLEYDMTAPDGTFLGKGFTDVKENKLWYKGYEKPFVFNEVGEYTVKIQQAMRENGKVDGVENLEGITEVGFRIEHSNTN
ncbi:MULTISPECIES: gliding motility lipoprotein GldH [Meridianimaribacter]|uniref:Protein involved in gliding motility GldH n=1 Tax=Meridianimaribacter flavus TaxID=571115 RepID=A0ABY2G770_9FLAO|nr:MULTISPECIES: gliding motility lipoprotein GldH [Meridianimaribacter]TBV28225.1 gliding motility lipoprotein GldH [Meridianimaribacter sp. CL38]TDY13645.1 protein involved in gliding motility GldH [Meridianimaribacter flavus]